MNSALCNSPLRRSRPGVTLTWGKQGRRSRTSRRIWGTAWSWCCCWRSSQVCERSSRRRLSFFCLSLTACVCVFLQERGFPNQTEERCASTRSPTWTKLWTTSPVKEWSWCRSAPRVRETPLHEELKQTRRTETHISTVFDANRSLALSTCINPSLQACHRYIVIIIWS